MSKLSILYRIVTLVCLVLIVYSTVYLYRSVEESRNRIKEESRGGVQILTKLSKLIVLPSIQPTIAIVKDNNILRKKSAFFNKAKQGDAIIIYPDKVIIFDVDAEKIVDIGLTNKKDSIATPSGIYQ